MQQPIAVVWHKSTDLRTHDHEPLARAAPTNLAVVQFPPRVRPATVGADGAAAAAAPARWHAGLRECLEGLNESSRRARPAPRRAARRHREHFPDAAAAAATASPPSTPSPRCSEEVAIERRVAEVLRAAGARLREKIRGFTHHRDDLPPRRPPSRPTRPSGAAVQEVPGAAVRERGAAAATWRSAARARARGAGAGRLPEDLGFGDLVFPPRDDRAPVEFVGGERVALAWVNTYVSKFLERYAVGATNTMRKGKSAIGRDATTKFSPWLAHGCVSARRIYHLVEKIDATASRRERRDGVAQARARVARLPRSRAPRCGALDLQARRSAAQAPTASSTRGAVPTERLERWIEWRGPFVGGGGAPLSTLASS